VTTLVYRRPSLSWLDRLPLGDGRIGAMVGAERHTRRIGLNEASAWSGGVGSAARDLVDERDAAAALARARALLAAGDPVTAERALTPLQHRYAQAFLPVGEVTVHSVVCGPGDSSAGPADVADVVRRLDLSAGLHTADVGAAHAETIVSAAHGVVVHRETYEVPHDVTVAFSSPLRTMAGTPSAGRWVVELALPADVAPGHEPQEPAVTWDVSGVLPGRVTVATAVTHDGDETTGRDGIVVRGATRMEMVIAVETQVPRSADDDAATRATARAMARVDAALAAPDRFAAHALVIARDAGGFALELGAAPPAADLVDPDLLRAEGAVIDPRLLAGLVAYGVHLLRASSRADGPPANLQGIWNDSMQPPWSSGYTLNINTPMNHWAAEATGASDAHLALLGLLERLADRGRDTARRLYGARGWVAHHNTDVWGYTLPTWGDASWSQWPLGGAWLVRQVDEHRRHGAMTGDTLRRYRPVLVGCARFLLDWLVEADGGLHTSPSTSPENRFLLGDRPASLTRSSALDRALIRDVLAIAVEIGGDDALAAEASAALSRIDGPRVDAAGRIAEWGEERTDEDPHHRHLSHVYPWFPGATGERAAAPAVARSLDDRGDDSTGWSLAWKIALRARLGDGDAVDRLLALVARAAGGGSDAQRGGLYPNLLAAHPPFQIDGNLGLVGALLEALVQSHRPGVLDLLPALPPSLPDGHLRGFVARPGVMVDLRWRSGVPDRLRLRARSADTSGALVLVHADTTVPVTVTTTPSELVWPRRRRRVGPGAVGEA